MEENEEFDSDFHSEDIPISEEFWNYMEHYWHNNREFPESTEASLNKKADLVDGKVPSSQLPSYVDDVLEFDSFENLPSSGEKGKIYLITNNNTQFRWSGSEYIQLNSDEYFMTTNTYQDITGRKDFHNNSGLNELGNNKLWAVGSNGSKAGISFYSEGMDTGNLLYDGDYHFLQGGNTYYKNIKSAGFVKENSNDDYILTGGGGHELKSNYLLSTEGNNRYFPRSTDSNSVIDLNNLTLEGVYYGYQWLNVPISTIATATVKIYSPDWIRQEYSPIDGSGVTYIRDRHNGTTWGDWKTVANRDWVTANFTTLDTEQYIPGTKWFITSGGNQYLNHGLRVLSQDGSNPGVVFYKEGANVGTIQYDGPNYLFTTSNTNAFANVVSAGFIKEGSNDDYALLGGGGHMPVSSFASGNYTNYQDNREINPSEMEPKKLGYGFTTWDNNNNSPYADYLHFGGYQDNTGGRQNLIVFRKDGFGLRQWQGEHQNTDNYSDYVDYWHTGNLPKIYVDYLAYLHEQGAVTQSQLSNYVTINTPQEIEARKIFRPGIGNRYDEASLELRGSNADGIYPTLSFHVPGFYAATVSYRGHEGFYFMNLNASGFEYVRTAGFIKEGSSNDYLLLGGGSHKNVSDFATSTDLNNYVTINTPQWIIADKNFASTSNISFYGNEENQVDVWKTSSGINNIVSGHVYHFYDTRWKVGNKRSSSANSLGYSFQFSSDGGVTYADESVLIQADGNILTSNFGAASDWNAKVSQSQLIDLDNKTFKNNADNTLKTIDASNYNDVVDGNGKIWLGNFYALPESTTGFQSNIGTILNINGLVSHDKTQLIFNGSNGSIQYRTSWYANTPWSPVRTLWDSNNFNPAGYVSKSGDTMTGKLNALTISAQNAADRLIYDNIENFGSTLKINANASLGIQLQSNNNTKVLIDDGGSAFYGNVTLLSGLYIRSNGNLGTWKGADNNTNYLIWRNYSDTKDIAYIGADGNSAAGGGVGDGFAIVAPSGRLQLIGLDGVTINGNAPWTAGNFDPDTKVNAYEKATSLGFSASNSNSAPYIIHTDDGYVFLVSENATQDISGQKYFKKPLFVFSPDSVRGNLGSVGTNYKAQFSNDGDYGTAFWVEGSGEGFIQQQRFDGTPTAYRLNLQPLGGELFYGDSEVATQNDLNGYAKLNAIQTFTNINSFVHSPRIPVGLQLDSAVNLAQLNSKVNALDSIAGIGFNGGNINQPIMLHSTDGLVELATYDLVTNMVANRVRSENGALALGFAGGTPDTPYVKHSNGTEVRVATETWSSNSFLTIYSDQNVTGIKTFTVSPKVPSANNPDEAVNLGQALELTEDRTNSRFLTRTTSGSSTYDLVGYGRPKMTNIICKGNGGFSLDIDGFEKGMTVKISNTTGQTIDVNFNNGSVSTAVDIKNWTEFHMDSEGDIIRTDANQATII